ncbi:MAG: flagellar hook-length control protein FliK [Alkalimonas sp.]|nr:flagellar hook-length control protein FliK [Alkalimonas sp.]
MNPIKLDQLLQIKPTGKMDAASIQLQADRLYPGVLLTDPVQGARLLQLSTSQGLLQIRLPASVTGNNGSQLQASFSQQPDGRIQVTIQAKGEAVQSFPLNQQQALTLALNWAGSSQLSQQQASSASQIPVELTIGANQTQLRLPQGSVLTLPTALHKTMQSLQAQYPTARLQASITLGTGQEPSLFIEVKTAQPSVAATQTRRDLAASVATAALQPNSSPPSKTASQANASSTMVSQQLTLPIQLQQQLLSRLADSVQNTALPARLQQQYLQLGSLMLPLPQVRLPTGAYQIQLQHEHNNWQLQLQSLQKTDHKLTVSTDSFNRPVQLSGKEPPQTAGTTQSAKPTSETPQRQLLDQAWRTLMPLLSDSPSRLAALPELPQPVQQVLQLIRQSQPSGQNILNTQQLQQQLQAILQFNPMLTSPQVTSSAAGTLAVAIQLLLGKLSQRPVPAQQQTSSQRLVQLVQQMEPGSASSLLRQLASHSSALQQGQLATAELPQGSQFVLQLPLQQDQQTVLSQLRIEQKEEEASAAGQPDKIWQLTMRFQLSEYGDLLAVARLQDAQLKLQLYTDQAATQRLAEQFLPILSDRLKAQGIEVKQAECQLGKIPETLMPRHSSLIAIQV